MLIHTLISSGFNVSEDIDQRRFRLAGIQCPSVNSGDLAFRVSFDPTSALFTRLLGSSGDLRFPINTGSRSLATPRQLESFPFARLETLSVQTDNRTFVMLAVPRN